MVDPIFSDHAEGLRAAYWAKQPSHPVVQKNKRGRASVASPASAKAEKKPSRTSLAKNTATNGTNKRKAVPVEDDDDDVIEYEKLHVDSMDKYQDVIDWEDLVGSIETIQRGDDGELKVFMTMWV